MSAKKAKISDVVAADACGCCHHWRHREGAEWGTCKRFPPTPLAGAGQVQPLTQPQDWCGEFEPIAPEPAKPVGFAAGRAVAS